MDETAHSGSCCLMGSTGSLKNSLAPCVDYRSVLAQSVVDVRTSLLKALLIAFKSCSGNPFFCAGTTFLPGITNLSGVFPPKFEYPSGTVVPGRLKRILGVGSDGGTSEMGVWSLIIFPGAGSGRLDVVISAILMKASRIASSN